MTEVVELKEMYDLTVMGVVIGQATEWTDDELLQSVWDFVPSPGFPLPKAFLLGIDYEQGTITVWKENTEEPDMEFNIFETFETFREHK